MIDDPHLVIVAHGDGDRLETDDDRADRRELGAVDREDLEAIVGRIDREQPLAARRQRQRTYLQRLEERVRATGRHLLEVGGRFTAASSYRAAASTNREHQ